LADDDLIRGLVIKAQSGFFTVQTEAHGLMVSRVRGRLLEERLDTDPVAIGDWVKLSLVEVLEHDEVRHSGVIEEVEPRERAFTRQSPSSEGRRADKQPDREQVIIANPDQVVLVFASANPEPKLKMLDRFLVIAERSHIPAIICANKIDLVGGKRGAQKTFGVYEDIGYTVIYTSAAQQIGIRTLKSTLNGKVSALTGPSGVGKSSLMNTIQPGLGLAVKDVSEATTKGKHTTVASELYPLKGGGYVADTPGIRAIGLFNIEPSELDGYFPDIEPYLNQCRFKDCRHEIEPGCAVKAAVESEALSFERYDSYLKLREEAEEIYYRC
jgi:ribosome biogenesis GTPase / thiamine phosphate phosphatase